MRHIPADKIFISSTVYGLEYFRQFLMYELKRADFEPFTFEGDRVSPDPNLQSHDMCLDLINDSDSVIGLINNRPGSKYVGTKYLSLFEQLDPPTPETLTVTQAEIILSLELNKPTIVLVLDDLWMRRQLAKDSSEPDKLISESTRNFLNYLTNRKKGNWMYTEAKDAIKSTALVKKILIPKKRLRMLAEAMSGNGWNGANFFPAKEVTVENKKTDGHSALKALRVVDISNTNLIDKLIWLVDLLADDDMTGEDKDFLVEYLWEYAGYSNPAYSFSVSSERRAIYLLERLHFGDNEILGRFQYRIGREPIEIKWPDDALKWSPHGRIEFILYSLKLENDLPLNLKAMIEFSSGIRSDTGSGFTAHYSRKPVTVGCKNACAVRLQRHETSRGIPLEREMKSMIYVSEVNNRYCLVAVHGIGSKYVIEDLVIKKLIESYSSKIDNVNPIKLETYLQKIGSPVPQGSIYGGRKLLRDGAQQMLGLYASAINPVSVLKCAQFKYGHIQNINVEPFDLLMLWDTNILDLDECYNNAGSPTWGVRFNPKLMYDHVRLNCGSLTKGFQENNFSPKFEIAKGPFFGNKKS